MFSGEISAGRSNVNQGFPLLVRISLNPARSKYGVSLVMPGKICKRWAMSGSNKSSHDKNGHLVVPKLPLACHQFNETYEHATG